MVGVFGVCDLWFRVLGLGLGLEASGRVFAVQHLCDRRRYSSLFAAHMFHYCCFVCAFVVRILECLF